MSLTTVTLLVPLYAQDDSQDWKRPLYPSIWNWFRLWYVHVMEYYTAVNNIDAFYV